MRVGVGAVASLRLVFLVDDDEGLLWRIAPGLWLVDRRRKPIGPALREGLAAGRILGRPSAPANGQRQRHQRHADEDRGEVFVERDDIAGAARGCLIRLATNQGGGGGGAGVHGIGLC